MNYKLSILLKSETIIGSGNSLPGSIDNDLVYSDTGMPIIKGKTIKGNLRESLELMINLTNKNHHLIELFFGKSGPYNYNQGIIMISDASLSDGITNILEKSIKRKIIFPEELKEALANDRDFTQLKNGVAMDKSLRKIRTLNSGIEFWADLDFRRELSDIEKSYLAGAISLLRNIGLMRNRGKGEVECRLWLEEKDITIESLNELERSLNDDELSDSRYKA